MSDLSVLGPHIQATDLIRRIAGEVGISLPDEYFQVPEFVPIDFKSTLVHGVSERDYHTDMTAVARGDVVAYLKTPAHVSARRQKPFEQSESEPLRFGRLVHCALLEPQSFKERFIIEPVFEGYTDKGKLTTSANCKEVQIKKAEWHSNLPADAIVMSKEDMVHLFCMARSIAKNPVARRLFDGAFFEMTGYYRDPQTGLKCRIRPDMINPGMNALIDLKTAVSASPSDFQNSNWKHRYDIQEGMYASGIEQITGQFPDICAHIVVEKEPPYGCAVYTANRDILKVGIADYRKALNGLAQSVQANSWPSYSNEAMEIELPRWVQFQQRELGVL